MTQPNTPLAERFEAAAAVVAANAGLDSLHPDEVGLLRYLTYDDGNAEAAAGRARLLRAGSRLRRLFLLPVPDAPGLVFFGGEIDPVVLGTDLHGMPVSGVAGSGATPQRAFESCIGEAIEHLSQYARPFDRIVQGSLAGLGPSLDPAARRFVSEVLAAGRIQPARSLGWVPVRAITTGAEAWFPADLCLRRPIGTREFSPPLKLSTGCAAGVTADEAALRGVLELIERDAAALWWRGGRRGRAITAASTAGRAAGELLARLRGNQDARRTWLLDITTDLGVPAVAAVSATADGHGFAFGLGARLTLADAACAALFELCQVELGPRVADAKRRESGDDALGETDLGHLRRSTLVDTRTCVLLHPDGEAGDGPSGLPTAPAEALQFIAERLAGHGITAYRLDVTRPDFDVPVVRVLAPGLQLDPCTIIGERLAKAVWETGGGARHNNDLSLL
jgi:ribosomal protein S12 methylthiotransferase accessory factor